jgi:hypothetical protein
MTLSADLFARWLRTEGACEDGREWAASKTPADAWAACPRGDWLLWWAARAGVDRRRIVLAACACARLALPHVAAGEERPLMAIETAERWARGEAGITLAEVRAAADAAAYAATYAAAYAATYAAAAADAAAYAATYAAADAAAYAAADAAAAYAAADAAAAYADDWRQKRAEVLAQCSDLVRAQIPWAEVEAAHVAMEAA